MSESTEKLEELNNPNKDYKKINSSEEIET